MLVVARGRLHGDQDPWVAVCLSHLHALAQLGLQDVRENGAQYFVLSRDVLKTTGVAPRILRSQQLVRRSCVQVQHKEESEEPGDAEQQEDSPPQLHHHRSIKAIAS